MVEPDGYLEITFYKDRIVSYPFKELKGWRFEHDCVRLFFENWNTSYPLAHVLSVKIVYNSPEVQEQLVVEDTFVCPKCGGDVHV